MVGLPSVVIPAVVNFKTEVEQRCGQQLEWSESEIYCPQGVTPEGVPDGLSTAGEVRDGRFLKGLMCYGVPIGEKMYVEAKLSDKVDKIVSDAKKAVEVLGNNKQALWSCLRLSISTRFDYWLQH